MSAARRMARVDRLTREGYRLVNEAAVVRMTQPSWLLHPVRRWKSDRRYDELMRRAERLVEQARQVPRG